MVFKEEIRDRSNYRCFHFFFYRLTGAVDSVACAGKSNFSLRVVLVELGGDIDSATCRGLHFLDCLSACVCVLVSL